MAHVTYEGDNFLVYPVQALGSYYTLSEPQFHSKKSANTVLRVAITAAFKNTKIFVKDKIQELKNDKNIISSNIANLSLNENDVTVLEFTHTFRYLHIESSSYLFVLVWSTREKELDFIEQLAPDFTWGAEYIFPVPAWISDQIQVSITAGDIMEMRVIIRTKQRMKLYMIEGNGHLTMDVPADGFVHVSSSVNVQVLFLVWSKGEEYSKSSLIAGVALSQYRPITCQFKPTPQVFTTIAYLQYDLRSFKNVTDLFGNSSTVLNFTIIEGIRARRIKAPYLHEVVGVFSMFVRPHVLTDKLQLFTGANMHKHHPTSSSDRLNVTTMSKKATYFNDTSNETYTQIYSFNENSEIFEFIGCPETEVSGKTSWLRGRLKRNGVSASVIAVIISIVIAVFGVIGFIIGLMIIDMTGDQRHVRPIRIAPIVEDPSLQE